MAVTIISFVGTAETVHTAVTEAQDAANKWLAEQTPHGTAVKLMQTNTLTEINKATGGTSYSHVITLIAEQP